MDEMKNELALNGLKCGGGPKERAERLLAWKTARYDIQNVPKKYLPKP